MLLSLCVFAATDVVPGGARIVRVPVLRCRFRDSTTALIDRALARASRSTRVSDDAAVVRYLYTLGEVALVNHFTSITLLGSSLASLLLA